jgi:tetratricopeptide (TPR) repeat protein
LINLGDQLSAAARADAYIGRGMERYWMSSSEVEYKPALADFDEAIRLDPKRPLAYLGRGWSLAHLVNAQIDVRPGAQINAELGAQIENKVDQQIADYSQAISLDPTLAKAYLARGVAYMRQGNNSDAAIADFSKAIELAPDWASAYEVRGNLYVEKKKYKEALADYRANLKLLEAVPNKDDDDIRRASQRIQQTEPLAGISGESSK